MPRGPIVRLIRDRGYGFVRAANGNEIFMHASALPQGTFDALTEGQQVDFDIENDPRGRGERAVNVQLVSD